MTIIVAGGIGRSGLGGQAWAYLQYLIGFRALGHDVYYLEDCGETSSVWNWDREEWTQDLAFPAAYVRDCLKGVCAKADLLIVRAIPLWDWRPEYDLPARRIFIDVDPGFTQMNIAGGDQGFASAIRHCERLFTIGQRLSAPDCPVPTVDWQWLKTLPLVALT